MDILHIGLGIRSRHWLEIVRDRKDMNSVGCVTSQAASRDWVKQHFSSVPCYEHLADALRHVQAEAAIVASEPAQHAAQTIAALEAGLAVMVEKPLAARLADGVQMVEASRRTSRPLMVAQNYRYRRCEQALREFIRDGKVGTISHVSCIDRRDEPVGDNYRSRMDYVQVMEVGEHHFDSLRHVLGVNPVRVLAHCGQAPWGGYQHGATTEAFLEMEAGIRVQYYGSLTANRYEHELWIEGEHGALRMDSQRVWWRKRGARFFLPLRMPHIQSGDAMRYPRAGTASLLDQFHAAVRDGAVPQTSGEDNLWSLAMVEGVMMSDRDGQAIGIAEMLSHTGHGPAVGSHSQNGQDTTS
ncbi:Gfo/Idh/MocA family protein [Candidatus Entotheonella palauensis]|uniref:Gfo/Idh/MocA-like oxidoreductase N-terminal domain-containing protein n=1 Tax=Candidatus Entotheonella gemina TaxID=1429439 RepID=W4MF73_9BACT|nr:Gfo/Idh/MocA family oxidoreductase [Candidatus Entotheonella palauensis]ETX08591.1 MAG: hypothetical protein ETSY2_04490 [Candidatus Entotheonella gemina]